MFVDLYIHLASFVILRDVRSQARRSHVKNQSSGVPQVFAVVTCSLRRHALQKMETNSMSCATIRAGRTTAFAASISLMLPLVPYQKHIDPTHSQLCSWRAYSANNASAQAASLGHRTFRWAGSMVATFNAFDTAATSRRIPSG